jgi:hypothetical protein
LRPLPELPRGVKPYGDALEKPLRIANITKSGRRALRNDTQMTPLQRLFLEIVARTGNITEEHMFELADEMVRTMGSVDAALLALKSGQIEFEPK